MKTSQKYDVIILGGGLAGFTLALQLKQAKSEISILILEKRPDNAPVATHKVGESIVELGSFYLREVLQLKEYLIEHQLPKLGFRFFFSQEDNDNIAKRVEVGTKTLQPIPAHQIDRGVFENDLETRLSSLGVDIILGATAKNVELSKTGHKIHFEKGQNDYCYEGNWVIDSTGRRGLLKRMLKLDREIDHDVNAVWFRLAQKIDIDHWSEDEQWCNAFGAGHRYLATNHLMGEGYWVWLIPLVSGNTSIGIVADPLYHSFDQINTSEKAFTWLKKHEPLAADMLGKHKEQMIDFKVMKHFAHDTKQFYSTQRWALTGDSGAFLDPFYSPGTDFIALTNSWITELIVKDFEGENISLRTMIYEHTHRELFKGWTMLYKNMYGLFGKTQIILLKIVWDWATYWAIPTLMFMNKAYTNLSLLKQYASTDNSIGIRFSRLNKQMQELFLAWSQYDIEPCSDRYINVFELDSLYQFHLGLAHKYEPKDLIKKIKENLTILEEIAAEIFRLVSEDVHRTPSNMKVDPYNMSLTDTKEVLLSKAKDQGALAVVDSIRIDISKVWLNPKKTRTSEYF